MKSIAYIGMDVHTSNYTLCAYTLESQKPFAQMQIHPDMKELEQYLEKLKGMRGEDCQFILGYEAGCLGYSLYHELQKRGYKCVILAPTTMPAKRGVQIKTDKRDALNIAQCLAYGTYSAVYVPSDEDNAVKEYIRMRDDANKLLRQTKQQLLALCNRHGKQFDGVSKWTQRHMEWLRGLKFALPVLQETLEEYLATYHQLRDKVDRMDARIAELAAQDAYKEKVRMLGCLKGIATHTALSCLVEIGDFSRFPSARQFSAFLGLVPGEHSSGDHQCRGGITKAGNSHLRRLLIEAAQGYGRGCAGRKSKALKARQAGCPPEIIAYADKANERLRRKYIRIMMKSGANVAKTAVARELACFIWGMMNGKTESV